MKHISLLRKSKSNHSLRYLLILICLVPPGCRTGGTAADISSDTLTNNSDHHEPYCKEPSSDPLPTGRKKGPTCQEIASKYPKTIDPNIPEDKRVICPFMRILKRTGLLDQEIAKNLNSKWAKNSVAPISVIEVAKKTPELGCQGIACAAVAEQVAMSQNKGWPALTVDIGRLFAAPPRDTYKNDGKQQRASHDCGYTFKFGDEKVNDEVRTATLKRFKELAQSNNERIKLEHLVQVKKESCKRDYLIFKTTPWNAFSPIDEANKTLLPDNRDHIEVALIWAYLGGVERGWISVVDLDRFFHGMIPPNKTKFFLDVKLLGDAMAAHKNMW